ncbi:MULTISPECIES: cation-translocating P-type ATPase [Pseudanabaena]|uniref:ATPase, P-type (Transporting), HAD superfamily, subfamily IC n=2 Tax=Pseudanabaena TaxID=1152 RepID=L8MYG3_9CYAN|nr:MULTISPECIES: cation-translocating P-type ATPase [Pseudanabaena]ELS32526.1 ATPase, P-type (transporting), HAD superfamily, subfamily IC [Pseudanabaena biceps PCC 7429]MDG3495224.1 cation-translocating P-type ATPase [Pseudanabaena catenata USMAC16]
MAIAERELEAPPNAHWHTLDVDESIALLQSDADQGITNQEVETRFQRYGANELVAKIGRSSLQIFIDQFTNIMLIMLMAVAVVSAILDIRDHEFPKDAIAISSIVLLNGILGYMQETNAEKALAALKRMSSPKVRVIRDGGVIEIDGKNLVPGDIMLLEAGVQVAADGRLLDEQNLQVRESALTGEAEAVNKEAKLILEEDAGLGDRLNCVYQGTEVVQGRAKVLVTKTGMQTELGKIAALIQNVETEDTPLQQRMTQLGNVLVTGSLVLVGLVVVGGMLNKGDFGELLKTSLSMAVAVVPEGLPAVVTVTLALGTQRMVRRNALIRRLPAVETLGSVTTICSDKTGTLTQNKMVVQGIRTGLHSLQVTGDGYAPIGEFTIDGVPEKPTFAVNNIPEVQQLLMACVFCNDAILQQKNGEWIIIGDPTEGALIVLASKGGCDAAEWQHRMPRVFEVPFSSERKRMSVLVQGEHGGNVLFCKGSPELTLECCTHIQIGDRIDPIADLQRQQVLAQNNELASRGLRVLGFAYRNFPEIPEGGLNESDESNLIWVGLVGMLDAPRPEVREAVKRCREAGIRPVMITGDHQLTAKAIAEDLGIAQLGDRVLTGRELEKMSATDLDREVQEVSVYARVSPEHKLRIVQSLQRQHQFVAMTGDGVNDAPALKQADIGIAMGITGTDVSKEASDMILLDDNFATIVAATEEGRVVYTNIRRFIKYILGSNIGEVITIATAPLIGLTVPLSPLQILWMNLVTDGLPALALAVEPAEPNVMKKPPVDPRENIFARGMGAYMVRIGIILAIITIVLMVWAHGFTNTHFNETYVKERWATMVFTTLCLAQMGHAIAIRSNTQLTIELNPMTNLYVWGSVIMTTVLQLVLIYVEPFRRFFGTHLITPTELAICFGFSALMFVWIELEKLVIRWWLWQRQT